MVICKDAGKKHFTSVCMWRYRYKIIFKVTIETGM